MKKIFLLLILLTVPLVLSAQWYGDGLSAGTAYYGVINSSYPMQDWNITNYPGGVIYVGQSTSGHNDLEIGNGGTLTISQGITVKFCTTASDLRITGTGILNASGSSSSFIVFTKDAQATWGHISFETSTGSSTINYCEIEYGSKTGSGLDGYGGGIQIKTTNLTVSNCLIHHNIAKYGGGIFVNQNVNPTIYNCHIYSNTATTSGGGLYFWAYSSPITYNCIIDYNTCTDNGSTYGGGGLGIYTTNYGTAYVLNCTIVNNTHQTTSTKRGDNIHLNASNAIRFINCIVWGSDYSVFIDVTARSYNFINSAVQRIYNASGEVLISSYTNSFKINSSNTGLNPDGPFFKETDGSDWSIEVVSPCRDAGTTPTPTVPTDYAGNSRVRTYDIGAYEVQYNYWLTSAGTTDWATGSNWNGGVPTSSQNVVIPTGASNYPAVSTTIDFTIGSGYGMVLDPGAKVTLDQLTASGDLKLMSNASNISSLIINNSGVTAIEELYLSGGGSPYYKWHYISSPVSSLPVSTFAPTPTINFAQYFEARPSTDPLQGWIGYDGYIYFGGGFLTGLPYDIRGTNLTVGKGYNYYYTSSYKFTFSGDINVSSVFPTITYGGAATLHGFNLLGNPFSSGLDWNTIINDAGFPTSTSKGLYFTRNNSQCSYIAGVGYPDASVTGIIPPMQGFFIHTTIASTTLPLLAGARVHDIPARYKGEKEIIPLVRLQLDNDSTKDNTVVRFDIKASTMFDNDFDAVRMFLDETNPFIYSTDGLTKYSINGQPFPEQSIEIPVVINITQEGIHTLTATQLQGLDDYTADLIDNVTGFTARLSSTPVLTFSSTTGLITDRFILKISNIATAVENPIMLDNTFNIYQGFGLINIQTIADEWDGKSGSVKVLDLAGKTITNLQNTEFNKNSVIQVQAPETKGLYMVEIRSGVKRYVGKVIVK